MTIARTALVLDDQPLVASLTADLVKQMGFDVHTASTMADALQILDDYDIDLVVTDLDLGPGPSGVDLWENIRKNSPWIAIVILTVYPSPELVKQGAGKGLDGAVYVVKSQVTSSEELRNAIEEALGLCDPRPKAKQIPGTYALTRTQADVLRLISKGLSNDEIARERQCSRRSVEEVIERLYAALGLDEPHPHRRVTATRMYLEGKVQLR